MTMLQITVPGTEFWDSQKQEFVTTTEQKLQLEHSLVSLSKWESKWCKPFLANDNKTDEELLDYIRCMTITQNVKPETYESLSRENLATIDAYINAPMTATTFSDTTNRKFNREIITSEIIYYWMVSLNIPSCYEKWHLNRLITLIKVCNIKNQPPRKMGRRETMSRNAAINASRRRQLNTKG
jgi:hypothetical protein